MKNLWNDKIAKSSGNDLLAQRVYSSQLLGTNPSLVLHGGGNTSVKSFIQNIFNETEEIIYVKGSGWDLQTITKNGFAPVKIKPLLNLAKLPALSDSEMVKQMRAAMIDPYAPTPSVEAILHALIPFKFVDHTHADAIVTITNTPNGKNHINEIYGKSVLIVPYIMPGFVLAKQIFELTKNFKWNSIEGIILLNHGVFTFHDNAKIAYSRMINIVSKAEEYIKRNAKKPLKKIFLKQKHNNALKEIAQLRKDVFDTTGKKMLMQLNCSEKDIEFSVIKNAERVINQGPLTPDHIIRTKRIPLLVKGSYSRPLLDQYCLEYKKYFNRHRKKEHKILDTAPRWIVWKNKGMITIGKNEKEINILNDICHHTIKAIRQAESLGGWKALPEKDLFEVEYWELEQAKLGSQNKNLPYEGKVVIVTGAANGIGKATALKFASLGATVAAIDIDKKNLFNIAQNSSVTGFYCDVTNAKEIDKTVSEIIKKFGGVDILFSNVGAFIQGEAIGNISDSPWKKSMDINLTSHLILIQSCLPFLKFGIEPSVIINGSKNVPAPGYGAASYSVAKAGLTQFARIAALELGKYGIRVNVIHPNMVFDTNAWNDNLIKQRAASYGQSESEYKTNNILKTVITSDDVADLVVCMAGSAFAKTTGAQVPIDGGNERVI